MTVLPQTQEEKHNTVTHLIGVVAAASTMWVLVVLASPHGWKWIMGVLFLAVGTMLMYSFSTAYHWTHKGSVKSVMRVLDHIGIYVMIACSYTPLCIAVIGGWVGWTVFGMLWGIVLAGSVYKIKAIGKYPRLSLFLYLLMGWSAVFMAKPIFENISALPLLLLLAEGLSYTSGTYFFAHDDRHLYHAVWHIFVLLGTAFHWAAVIAILQSLPT